MFLYSTIMQSQMVTPALSESENCCFDCKYFRGLTGGFTAGLCKNPDCSPVRPSPQRGCAHWTHDPSADPAIRTCDQWVEKHGLPVPGFTDRLDADRWPAPLTGRQIRTAYEQNRTPQTQALAWEIARLQDVVFRLRIAIEAIAEKNMPEFARRDLVRLVELLGEEPGVAALSAKRERERKAWR